MTGIASKKRVLIVIPTLNEADHIAAVLDMIRGFTLRHNARVVVADGGSHDKTCAIVADRAAHDPNLHLLHNPARLQSAGINHAVAVYGSDCDWLLRLDAHSAYPDDFAEILLDEADKTGADSVVVSMMAQGDTFLQRAIAAAQNSRLGNGGAAHRLSGQGLWVDHGHHALMRLSAFRAVGGYDPEFSHNEDAELDHRLRAAGFRIWLTGRTRLIYFPRRTIAALWRQYFAFGHGRARNLAKHGQRPGIRQMIVVMLAPMLALAVLTPVHPIFAVALVVWVIACMAGGVVISMQQRRMSLLPAGICAGVMHLAWSTGYWYQRLIRRRKSAI